MKRTVPLIITAVVGVFLILANFVPGFSEYSEDATTFFAILAAIAFVLGGGSLLKVHLKKISDRSRGWGYSLIVLGSFFVMLAFGLLKLGVPPETFVDTDEVAKVFPYGRLLPIEVTPGGLSYGSGRIVSELGDEDDVALVVCAAVSIGYEAEGEGAERRVWRTDEGH